MLSISQQTALYQESLQCAPGIPLAVQPIQFTNYYNAMHPMYTNTTLNPPFYPFLAQKSFTLTKSMFVPHGLPNCPALFVAFWGLAGAVTVRTVEGTDFRVDHNLVCKARSTFMKFSEIFELERAMGEDFANPNPALKPYWPEKAGSPVLKDAAGAPMYTDEFTDAHQKMKDRHDITAQSLYDFMVSLQKIIYADAEAFAQDIPIPAIRDLIVGAFLQLAWSHANTVAVLANIPTGDRVYPVPQEMEDKCSFPKGDRTFDQMFGGFETATPFTAYTGTGLFYQAFSTCYFGLRGGIFSAVVPQSIPLFNNFVFGASTTFMMVNQSTFYNIMAQM